MAVKLWSNKIEQFCDGTGVPRAGAKFFTYVGGSVNTKQTTYTESTGVTPNTNPIVLDSNGKIPQPIWLTTGVNYKFVLAPPTDTDPPTSPIDTIDVVTGINDSSSSQSEWIAGPTPTFVSGTQFTLVGDQTTNFSKKRRLKFTVTAGTVYGEITASAFGASTAVTVALDSGALDSGLSAVSYSVTSSTNPSIDADMIYRKGTAVASAATTDIWSIAGDYVHVTGATGPITSFGTAPYAGAQRTVIFDSTPTITHNSTSLQLPGQQSITAVAGARAIVRADTTTNMIVVDYVPPGGVAVPRSYLAGLTMSTAGASATMSVAAGQAADSTNAVMMTLAASISKTTSAWAVGTAAGGLDTGAIANSTWYHFYEIMRPDTGVVDVAFSLNAAGTLGANVPAAYTRVRRIGSGKTDGSAQWVAFTQDGDYFRLSASVLDINSNNPGTSSVTATLASVPTGVNVHAYFNGGLQNASAATASGIYFRDLAATDEAVSTTAAPLFSAVEAFNAAGGAQFAYTQELVRTNTSAQIGYRLLFSDANVTARIATLGWVDRRGRDA